MTLKQSTPRRISIVRLGAIAFSAALLLVAGCKSASRTITVTNPVAIDRTEMAEVNANDIRSLLSVPFIITDSEGVEVPYQQLRNGNIIFPAHVAPSGSAKYRISPGTPAPVKPKVYGRHVPEHKDNMNWENDRAAYVAYGPALQAAGERGFGYDIWTKSVDTLVIDLRNRLRDQKISLHKDHGNGMDAYTVANTLGGGTAALLDDSTKIIFPWAWKEYEVLENGPLRFSVRLKYGPLIVDGNEVIETRVITLDQGADLNHTEVTYDGLPRPMRVAPGIVVHKQNPDAYMSDPDHRIIAYVDLTDNANNGNGEIYVGAIAPRDSYNNIMYIPIAEPAKDALGHILDICNYNPGDTFSYWWGSSWSKSLTAPASADDWMNRLRDYSICFDNPLKITIK